MSEWKPWDMYEVRWEELSNGFNIKDYHTNMGFDRKDGPGLVVDNGHKAWFKKGVFSRNVAPIKIDSNGRKMFERHPGQNPL